jgi:plastocyanin domain-containing protein
MSLDRWLVIAGALAAIALINWWFLVAPRRTAVATRSRTGPQEITITVRGGYDPSSIRVRHGEPIRLVFDRRETSSCSEEVVFPDFGIRKFLPPFQRTAIDLPPAAAGHYEFTCGMSMLRGQLIAE